MVAHSRSKNEKNKFKNEAAKNKKSCFKSKLHNNEN